MYNCCRGHFGWLESCALEKKQGIQYSLQLALNFQSVSFLGLLGANVSLVLWFTVLQINEENQTSFLRSIAGELWKIVLLERSIELSCE